VILFTPSHRGGQGPPLVLLHGFLESWRSWELVLPALERRHDVLAFTLPGHAGGPPLEGPATGAAVTDAVEAALDAAGLPAAHLAGNSLGGRLALELAARGRARSVVAFAPAGGWARDDGSFRELLADQRELHREARAAAPHAAALVATPEGRRRVSATVTERFEHIPADLLAHRIEAAAACRAAEAMVEEGLHGSWDLDAARIDVPVRIVWGTADRLLPWPSAAVRYRTQWLPQADWVVLDDVGHAPQLDVPLEAAELILGLTAGWPPSRTRRAP
jgi:pimeloyl-ACP methyl ester carboxylesterase